jgi:protein TonB
VVDEPPPVVEPPSAAEPAVTKAERAAVTVPKTPPRKSGGVADMIGYGRGVHKTVMRNRRYPASARRLGLQGTTKVKFEIDRNGRLVGKPSVAQSSGHTLLDDEALRMVEQSAPFSALPTDFDKPTATVTIPIRFSLDR